MNQIGGGKKTEKMGESSQPDSNSNIFSVRIVSIDYYMSPPIPGLDISYSSFQGEKVKEVPVIRIYGSTPAGQKTCLHIHNVLPYLYVPCSDFLLHPGQEGNGCTHLISRAMEKALKLKSNAGSKRQHVHSCSLVRAKKFYGYHSSEELFAKIYLYYPQDVSRASKLFLEGAVLDKVIQPHESHIPFILQFLVDYNLYGMGFIHVSKLKFRHPIPEVFSRKKSAYNGQQGEVTDQPPGTSGSTKADLSGDHGLVSPIWTSSTIPNEWIWQSWSQPDAPTNQDLSLVKRQSNSELEGDAVVEDIHNQLFISYTPLSQTHSDVKMVQSLIPIWEEEFERTGIQGPVIPPDPGKPLPEDGLRMLSNRLEMENLLAVLTAIAENQSLSQESIDSLTHMGYLTENVDFEHKDEEELKCSLRRGKLGLPSLGSSSSGITDNKKLDEGENPPNMKVSDNDALRLLKWLASSQAVEDINSDEELAHQTILGPLLPATTMDKVLERANTDFENQSQQECQDILDSVEDVTDTEGPYVRNCDFNDHKSSCHTSSNDAIPQVDGSTDDPKELTFGGKLSSEVNCKIGTSSSSHLQHGGLSIIGDRKRKRQSWGSLPVSSSSNRHQTSNSDIVEVIGKSDGQAKVQIESPLWEKIKEDKDPHFVMDSVDSDGNYTGVANTLLGCSMRDLMRKKRCYRTELAERSDSQGKYEVDTSLRAELRIDERISRSLARTEELVEYHDCNIPGVQFSQVSEIKFHKGYSSLHDKCPVASVSDQVQATNLSKVGQPCSSNGIEFGPDDGENTGLSFLGACEKASHFLTLENDKSAVSKGHDGSADHKSKISLGGEFPLLSVVGSSCQSSCPAEGDASSKGRSMVNSACKSRISVQEPSGNSDQNLWATRASTGITLVQPDIEIDSYHQTKNQSLSLCRSISLTVNMRVEPSELMGLTFFKKPPVIESTDDLGRTSASSLFTTQGPPVGKENERIRHQDVILNDLPHFFLRDQLDKRELQNLSCERENSTDNQQSVMGVPVHYQNDGSHLYMLTPILSPPSMESVSRWLSDGRDPSSISMSVPPVSAASPDNLYSEIVDSQGSLSEACNSSSPESSTRCILDCNLDNSDQQNQEKTRKPMEPDHDKVITTKINEVEILKFKPSTGSSQEMSQLSGPDMKSKLTPVSQIGFRDPASVGCGQQLTILSIEVQAESRGDLRPDPRFDAINIITLVVQEDNDSTADAFVLLRCNTGTCKQNLDGISDCKVVIFPEEKHLVSHFVKMICSFNPDILMGWDIQMGSLGFLAERAAYLGIGLLNNISRTPSRNSITSEDFSSSGKEMPNDMLTKEVAADSVPLEDAIIEDEWGRTHASGVHVSGRIVLNVWRLMRNEVKLNMYTMEAVADAVLRKKIPSIPCKVLAKWFSSGPGRARYRCVEYVLERAKLNLQLMNQLDMINRTSELARVFGIDFFSVLSRGSQFRVESMFLRLAHSQNYIAISPGNRQVAYQPAMECLPLVMEPESGFYADPVVVLDFQSLYPSMIIAYNLCFCTCLGKILPAKEKTLGVGSYLPDFKFLRKLQHEILFTPNGVMYVPSKVRKGVLPRLLEEILSTRIMVKQAMKKLAPSQQVLHRIFDARQLALKLISNVTYGYTAAGFSGRMPCAELADSIVQCARRTLETSILFVNNHDKWKARVIYGDTDSMFVLLKGRSRKEAFEIGNEIAAAVSAMNPCPVTLKMEKVYHPCFLLTKKRYVGYSYESPDQSKPKFDAKGIETVRRDTCGAVAKTMEQSLRIFFEHQDIDKVKLYLLRQWRRIISGKISLQDFVFAKEVRLGTYSARSSSLPPAAIVATKAMKSDPRAEPRYAERMPYVVVHGEPGARLVDMVVDPLDLLALDSTFRLNDVYYITKQIIPALQRVFGLVGADLNQWYSELPRPEREAVGRRHLFASNSHRTRIDFYYLSKHCVICGTMVQGSSYLCQNCSMSEATVAIALTGRTAKLERDIQHLAAICRHCGGGDWIIESGVKCTSLACLVFYERRKVQKELKSISGVATEFGFYPNCMVEWF